jgi:cytochrome c oxidase subunit 4
MSHSHSNSHAEELGHIVPESKFFKVLVTLLVLTIVTVVVAKAPQFNFGKWNIVGALLIATFKATMVIYVFMHAKYENKILWMYILIPFILLAIMLGGVFTDDPFRDHSKHFEVSQKK